MSNKEFDFDAFNKVLQDSKNICDGARKDIERAIKAGKGETGAGAKMGQVWREPYGRPYLIVNAGFTDSSRDLLYRIISLNCGNRYSDKPTSLSDTQAVLFKDGFTFAANTVAEYYNK